MQNRIRKALVQRSQIINGGRGREARHWIVSPEYIGSNPIGHPSTPS